MWFSEWISWYEVDSFFCGTFFPPKHTSYCTLPKDWVLRSFSSLLEADIICYQAINKTCNPPPLLCNNPVVRHLVVTSMLYHSTWLYSKLTWQLRAALRFRCSPSNLSLYSLLLCSCLHGGGCADGRGGLVKCIIYFFLPPWSGNHT